MPTPGPTSGRIGSDLHATLTLFFPTMPCARVSSLRADTDNTTHTALFGASYHHHTQTIHPTGAHLTTTTTTTTLTPIPSSSPPSHSLPLPSPSSYHAPPNFEPDARKPAKLCKKLRELLGSDSNKELWCLRVPANFDVNSLASQKFKIKGGEKAGTTASVLDFETQDGRCYSLESQVLGEGAPKEDIRSAWQRVS